MNKSIKDFLDKNDIHDTLHTHPAVFTVAEARKHCSFIPGLHCKNIFLKSKTKN